MRRPTLWIGALFVVAVASGVSACPFATLTGLPCPGCGMLRAVLLLVSGHFSASFHFHPLAPFVLPGAIIAWAQSRRAATPTRQTEAMRVGGAAVLLIALFAVWLLRFGGAFGGPVAVDSIWSATGTPSPFALARRGK